MNKDNAHLFLPIVQALSEGKQIQYQNGSDKKPCWDDFDEDEEISFHDDVKEYRIKPEPRTFTILRNKYSGAVQRNIEHVPESWERITVQEVLQ